MVWLLPLKHKNSVSWRIRTREVPDSGTPKSPKAEVNVAYDHEQYEWRDISTSFCCPATEQTYATKLTPPQTATRRWWDRCQKGILLKKHSLLGESTNRSFYGILQRKAWTHRHPWAKPTFQTNPAQILRTSNHLFNGIDNNDRYFRKVLNIKYRDKYTKQRKRNKGKAKMRRNQVCYNSYP